MNNKIAPPIKNPELNRVQEESDAALKELEEVVNLLNARLSRIMSPANSSSEVEASVDPKYYSKLAQDIDSHNNGILFVVSSIKSMLNRLEI